MKWYSKYLQVYEQPFASAPPEVVGFVKKKLRKLSENKQPLASVVLICHNEETRLLSCLWFPDRNLSGQQQLHRPHGSGDATAGSDLFQ